MSSQLQTLLNRVSELEKRQNPVVSEAELRDLTDKLQAHSVVDAHGKWTQARQEMQADRDGLKQQVAGLKQVEARAAEMKQTLEDLKLNLWLMQEDNKKVKARVEKDAGHASSQAEVSSK